MKYQISLSANIFNGLSFLIQIKAHYLVLRTLISSKESVFITTNGRLILTHITTNLNAAITRSNETCLAPKVTAIRFNIPDRFKTTTPRTSSSITTTITSASSKIFAAPIIPPIKGRDIVTTKTRQFIAINALNYSDPFPSSISSWSFSPSITAFPFYLSTPSISFFRGTSTITTYITKKLLNFQFSKQSHKPKNHENKNTARLIKNRKLDMNMMKIDKFIGYLSNKKQNIKLKVDKILYGAICQNKNYRKTLLNFDKRYLEGEPRNSFVINNCENIIKNIYEFCLKNDYIKTLKSGKRNSKGSHSSTAWNKCFKSLLGVILARKHSKNYIKDKNSFKKNCYKLSSLDGFIKKEEQNKKRFYRNQPHLPDKNSNKYTQQLGQKFQLENNNLELFNKDFKDNISEQSIKSSYTEMHPKGKPYVLLTPFNQHQTSHLRQPHQTVAQQDSKHQSNTHSIIHLLENDPQTVRCVIFSGYPPPSVKVNV